MSSLVACGVKTGVQVVRYFFVKNLERGDYTNDEILGVLENKLDSISQDLQDLKLQKLKSAAFLVKSGFRMYLSGDLEESRRNFDKAEMDSVEGFSTATTIEWKVLSIKFCICAHVWRKMVLNDEIPKYSAVMDQVLLYIHRLLEDSGLRNILKTHVSSSVFSAFNRNKRIELISQVVELDQSCRKILFHYFLEILPFSSVALDPETSVSLCTLYQREEYLVPYSVRQCTLMECSGVIGSWKNLHCHISLHENTPGNMISGARDQLNIVYLAQRLWFEVHQDVPVNTMKVKSFLVSKAAIRDKAALESVEEFEVTYMAVKLTYTSEVKFWVDVTVDKEPAERTSRHTITSLSEYNSHFYRQNNMVRRLNERPEEDVVVSCSFLTEKEARVRSVELVIHLKRREGVSIGAAEGIVDAIQGI